MTTLFLSTILAAAIGSQTGNRTTPPTLDSVAPVGISRGTTVELTVEGLNLAGSSKVYFSETGVSGKIVRVKEVPDLSDVRLGSNGTLSTVDLGPLPPRNQVVMEVSVAADAKIGPVRFSLLTPLGTTSAGKFLIEPYYGESPDKEPNDTPEEVVETYLPAILAGTISKPGDVDYFKIKVDAGERIVLLDQAGMAGSNLQPVVGILGEDEAVLKEFGLKGGPESTRSAYRFEKAGTYFIRVSDYAGNGGSRNFYRIILGKFPLVESVFPLGVGRGASSAVDLSGYNLGDGKFTVKGEPGEGYEDSLLLRPKAGAGYAFNQIQLAVGDDPEVLDAGTNLAPERAQAVQTPVTINGRIETAKGEHYYRFHARAGQKMIVDVKARRLGSPLDSFLEVLDAQGKPIERAEARAVWQTSTTLFDAGSSSSGIRIISWNALNVGDYVMTGNEITRVAILPKGPDEDIRFDAIDGERLGYMDTTPESHSVDEPVYKVQISPPGTRFSRNGLPLAHLYYQNDDGGPGYGKDSLVHFTAPADGDYLVRIRDVRGMGGSDYSYRLGIREPHPDFRLAADPSHPNVPAGGSIPISVEALRMDDFDGPIHVKVEGLPAGLHANEGVIAPGQTGTTLLLSADDSAKLDSAVPLHVVGAAGKLTHRADADDKLALVSVMSKADIQVSAGVKEVVLKPGGRAEIPVRVARQNGFRGRVPLDVRNLPPRVLIPDVGLNGVLITENENERAVVLEALPNCEPLEQLIYVAGDIETRSSLPSSYAAPQAILLKVKP
jgi:hypothetical protein